MDGADDLRQKQDDADRWHGSLGPISSRPILPARSNEKMNNRGGDFTSLAWPHILSPWLS
jgi:hypothetical protein